MDAQAVSLFGAIATAGKTIFEIAQGTTRMEEKQRLMEVYDLLMDLKRKAGDLEDANRELKEQVRFKSDEFEFKNPFWYDKNHSNTALCPKCFSKKIAAPVGAQFQDTGGVFRTCLTCGTVVKERAKQEATSGFYPGPGDSEDWML